MQESLVKTSLFAEGEEIIDENTPLLRNSIMYTNYVRRNNIVPSKVVKSYCEVGDREAISYEYESLDYDVCENSLFAEQEKNTKFIDKVKIDIMRLIILCLTAIITAIAGIGVSECSYYLLIFKNKYIKYLFDTYSVLDLLVVPLLIWILLDAAIVLTSVLIVSHIAPLPPGAGIIEVKTFLNGIDLPGIFSFKSLITRFIGVILILVSTLPFGMEAPMVYIGATIAACVSRKYNQLFHRNYIKHFHEDQETRDLIAAGAAAGIAAAFGTPLGALLFSLEEGASFWDKVLLLRIFFCTMATVFFLNLGISTFTTDELVNFGRLDQFKYKLFEIVICILIGITGGCLGAFFNYINSKIQLFRIRYINTKKWMQILEILFLSFVSTTSKFLLIMLAENCKPLSDLNGEDIVTVQYKCPDGEYSSISLLLFQPLDNRLRYLFYESDILSWNTAIFYFAVYTFNECWASGINVPGGILVPCMLIGALWGRVIGHFLKSFNTEATDYPGKFALIGGAAMLCGVTRLTLSLTVIIVEISKSTELGLPIMVTVLTAKWVGDFFMEGLYEIYIEMKGIPYLQWEAPPLSHVIKTRNVMSYPAVTIRAVEKVKTIMNILRNTHHNGFPVVDVEEGERNQVVSGSSKKANYFFTGMVLRSQLILLIQYEQFMEIPDLRHRRFSFCTYMLKEDFNFLPSEAALECTIDLRPVLNPATYTVNQNVSLYKLFNMFRVLGLRHIVVTNLKNNVLGIVTRKDLARYRSWFHLCSLGVTEVSFFYEKRKCRIPFCVD